jgi:L-ribulose-5-phosphate 3-epimerase
MAMNFPAVQLGVCSWSLHPRNVDDLLAALERLGLRRVQIALVPILQEPDRWRNVATRLAAQEVEIVSGMFVGVRQDYTTLDSIRATGGIACDANWAENLEVIRQTSALAADLGIARIGFHAGYIPPKPADPRFGRMLERVGCYGDLVAEQGMELVMETAEPAVGTLEAFLNRLRRANVGVNFDPGNMYMYGNPDEPVEALRRLMKHVRQVHLKDACRANTAGEWGEETPLGEGQVDWPGIFRELATADFGGPLLLERKVGPDPIRDLSAAQARIAAVLRSIDPANAPPV